MPDLSDYVERLALDVAFPGPSSPPVVPATLYLALYDEADAELSGNGYARIAIANDDTTWEDADTAFTGVTYKRNANLILSADPATGDWAPAASWKLLTAASGGTVIAVGTFSTPLTVLDTQKVRIQAGALAPYLRALDESLDGVVWEDFPPSVDSIVYYVDPAGDDSNDGLDPSTPKATIQAAVTLFRDGYPDQVLIKRGTTLDDQRVFIVAKSGRSATEPLYIGSYGDSDERPLLTNTMIFTTSGDPTSYLVIDGLHFKYVDSPTNTVAIQLFNYGTDILLQDCKIEGPYDVGLQIDGPSVENPIVNLTIRGCVVIDCRGQGILLGKVQNLIMEWSLFDHNGWTAAGASTQFTHNMYMYYGGYPATLRKCISARASSHGTTMYGGVLEDSLYLQNAIALFSATFTTIRRNVFIDGHDISGGNVRGWGIGPAGTSGDDIYDNIFAHQTTAIGGPAIILESGVANVRIFNNIVFDWATGDGPAMLLSSSASGANEVTDNILENPTRLIEMGVIAPTYTFTGNHYYRATGGALWFREDGVDIDFNDWPTASGESDATYTANSFPDSSASIGSYHASIGGTATLEAFLTEARLQGRRNWRPEYTAPAVNEYMRAAFGLVLS